MGGWGGQQRGGGQPVVGGGRGVDEPGQDWVALEAAGLTDRLDALDPAAAALGLGASLDLAHQDGVADGSFWGLRSFEWKPGGLKPGRMQVFCLSVM